MLRRWQRFACSRFNRQIVVVGDVAMSLWFFFKCTNRCTQQRCAILCTWYFRHALSCSFWVACALRLRVKCWRTFVGAHALSWCVESLIKGITLKREDAYHSSVPLPSFFSMCHRHHLSAFGRRPSLENSPLLSRPLLLLIYRVFLPPCCRLLCWASRSLAGQPRYAPTRFQRGTRGAGRNGRLFFPVSPCLLQRTGSSCCACRTA